MRTTIRLLAPILAVFLGVLLFVGNTFTRLNPEAVRDELLQHFSQSSSKVLKLSEAMPAELYDWSPGEGVMSVGQVFAHIARYNYMYLEDNLGVAVPEGIDLETLEDIRDKERLVGILQESVRHAQNAIRALNSEELSKETVLYGRTVEGWSVLVQLVAHLNEHTGQSVAYARMNNVVPPWSMQP